LEENPVAGIACLATPFQYVSLRDERLFDSKRLTGSMIAIWCVVVWSLGSWFGFIWTTALTGIGIFPCALLGAFLGRAIQRSREEAATIAGLFSGCVANLTNLLILRKVGDEASLALGGSQFLSWAMTKAFVNLSTRDQQPWRPNPFTGRPLPKVVRALWWATLAGLVTSAALNMIFQVKWPLVEVSFLAFPAIIATVLVNTTLFDKALFGAVALLLAGAISLTSFTNGTTIPRRWLARKTAGPFKRWLLGILIALQLDINAEVAPPGRWSVQQFVRSYDDDASAGMLEFFAGGLLASLDIAQKNYSTIDNLVTSKAMLHSLYEDPRAIHVIVKWLRAIINGVIE
jgi:hypothetical protein